MTWDDFYLLEIIQNYLKFKKNLSYKIYIIWLCFWKDVLSVLVFFHFFRSKVKSFQMQFSNLKNENFYFNNFRFFLMLHEKELSDFFSWKSFNNDWIDIWYINFGNICLAGLGLFNILNIPSNWTTPNHARFFPLLNSKLLPMHRSISNYVFLLIDNLSNPLLPKHLTMILIHLFL
ncbi:MAG: hypothetical protein Ta2E_09760 [Mycoplasmoidaceae bacterium]|nr:MAG: hypothetical protein Ta2E_09760 [Mycoplasmoidaceae bacterium]